MLTKSTQNEIKQIIKQLAKISNEQSDGKTYKEMKSFSYEDKEIVPKIRNHPLILSNRGLSIKACIPLHRLIYRLGGPSPSVVKNLKYQIKHKRVMYTIKNEC